MSFRRIGRKRIQFMARRAKALAAAGKKPVKRPRNPRISSYLSHTEYARFERFRKRQGCDASHVVRMAVLGLLKGVEPSETGAVLEAAADRERGRQITFRLMWLLQAAHWDPMILPPDEPLEKHFDAALITVSLARIKPELRSLMRRVAELSVPMEAPSGKAQDTSSGDASSANPEGANPS